MTKLGDIILAGALALGAAAAAHAQTGQPAPSEHPGCALSGSPNVMVEGRGMLRLGDVQACPGLRYEIIPNVFINGQPAVRLLPGEGATGGASSVTVDGAPAARQGDAR